MLYGNEYFERIVGKEHWRRLEREFSLQHTFKRNEQLTLFPTLPIKERIEPEVARVEPTIGVELLLLFDPGIADALARTAESDYHLRIYNVLRSISTLKGIEYYSASRKRMRTFFYDAYAIESPKNRERRDDPLVSSIPPDSTVYTYMKDSSLGNYVAEIRYHYHFDYFSMSIRNQTLLRRFIFPMVKPQKLNMFVLIVPRDDQMLFYGLSYVNATNIFGVAESKTASFYNRLIALFNWFRTNFQRAMQ
jgi:hypothetical protein